MADVTRVRGAVTEWRLPSTWGYAYAYVFFVGVFIGQTNRFFVGSEPLVGVQPAQIAVPVAAFAISAVLWLASAVPIRAPSGLIGILFGLLIFIWVWALIRDWGAVDLTAFTLGPFFLMLATKTPKRGSAVSILNSLGLLALVLFGFAALYAIVTDVPPTGFTTEWPPLTDPFDPIGMWWAPFNGPAEAGAIGAVLIVLGLGQRNVLRIPFVVGGGVILFYAGTLAAALGLGVALLVLLLAFAQTSKRRRLLEVGAVAAGLAGLVLLAQELIRNPTLSARTYIWSDFVSLLQSRPLLGWGSAALIESERTRTFPWGDSRAAHGSDAHNLLLDSWVRFGVVGALAVFAVLTVAVILAARGWKVSYSPGPALIALLLAIGVTESNIWWGAPGTAISVFVLAALSVPLEQSKKTGPTSKQAAFDGDLCS